MGAIFLGGKDQRSSKCMVKLEGFPPKKRALKMVSFVMVSWYPETKL